MFIVVCAAIALGVGVYLFRRLRHWMRLRAAVSKSVTAYRTKYGQEARTVVMERIQHEYDAGRRRHLLHVLRAMS